MYLHLAICIYICICIWQSDYLSIRVRCRLLAFVVTKQSLKIVSVCRQSQSETRKEQRPPKSERLRYKVSYISIFFFLPPDIS